MVKYSEAFYSEIQIEPLRGCALRKRVLQNYKFIRKSST